MSWFFTSGVQSIGASAQLSISFSISPSNEYPGLISFRMDWFDLLAVQGTFKSLLQYHSSKASILRCSAFCIVQLSHPYMTTGKTIAVTRRTLVGKVMSLLFFIYLIFYWRIIALQSFVVFCQISTWISHRYTYIPSPLKLPLVSLPIPGWYRAPVWVSWATEQIPIGCLFYTW